MLTDTNHTLMNNLPAFFVYLSIFIVFVVVAASFVGSQRKIRELESMADEARRRESDTAHILFDSLATSALVTDPNDDKIRALNAAAAAAGFHAGTPLTQYIDSADRAIYTHSRLNAGKDPCLCTVRMAQGGAHALIRTAVVSGAIPDLKIQANDRLSLVVLCSAAEADVIAAPARADERTRLGSFLKHGLAKTAGFAARNPKLDPPIQKWLLTFFERRTHVISALMSGWGHPLAVLDSSPADGLKMESQMIDVSKLEIFQMLENLRWLANFVSTSPELRREWEWSNGVLSDLSAGQPPFSIDLEDWPNDVIISTSIAGVPFFILEELLINTFKHGSPGEPGTLTAKMTEQDGRRWVEFAVLNKIPSFDRESAESARPYGGHVLIAEACRRGGWIGPAVQRKDSTYFVSVRAPS